MTKNKEWMQLYQRLKDKGFVLADLPIYLKDKLQKLSNATKPFEDELWTTHSDYPPTDELEVSTNFKNHLDDYFTLEFSEIGESGFLALTLYKGPIKVYYSLILERRHEDALEQQEIFNNCMKIISVLFDLEEELIQLNKELIFFIQPAHQCFFWDSREMLPDFEFNEEEAVDEYPDAFMSRMVHSIFPMEE